MLAVNQNASKDTIERLASARFSRNPNTDCIGLEIAKNKHFDAEMVATAAKWSKANGAKGLQSLLPIISQNENFSQKHFDMMFDGNEFFSAVSVAYACKPQLDLRGIVFKKI